MMLDYAYTLTHTINKLCAMTVQLLHTDFEGDCMNAVGYTRVSTDGQATDGVSLEAQQARIRAWCEANAYVLVDIHVDAGLSGCRADNRPGLQEALTSAARHKAALVVYSLSRLARSTKDAIAISERLAKNGANLVSLSERIDTTTAAGKMVFRMLAVLAEFERDQVAERTKGALAHLRNQGKRISGKIPYGYDLALRRPVLPFSLLLNPIKWVIRDCCLNECGRTPKRAKKKNDEYKPGDHHVLPS